LDPVSCRKNKCNIIKNKIMNGKIKRKEKNRFSMAFLIEYPPQIHSVIIVVPIIGTHSKFATNRYDSQLVVEISWKRACSPGKHVVSGNNISRGAARL